MKSSLTQLLLVLLVLILATGCTAGCAAGPNQFKGTPNDQYIVAGFWLGLWHGVIAPFAFVASFFKTSITIYEVHNSGAWYNFGFLFGLACFFRGTGNRTARKK